MKKCYVVSSQHKKTYQVTPYGRYMKKEDAYQVAHEMNCKCPNENFTVKEEEFDDSIRRSPKNLG